MRFLFSFAGGSGHALPLLPFARCVRDAGHTVAFAGRASALAGVDGQPFTVFPAPELRTGDPGSVAPLQPPSAQREDRVLREGFARRLARERASQLLGVLERFSADALICDEVDFGSMLAAERLGLPRASVLVMASGSFVRHDLVRGPLAELRHEFGLPPDPDLAMLNGELVLSPFPPRLRDPAHPLPATAHCFRPAPATEAERAAGAHALAGLAEAATVYFTLGTAFNRESGDLFGRVLQGLSGLPVNVVATVGPDIDPGAVGAQRQGVRVLRFVPQAGVLPLCALVVSHGGSGSVLGALAAGLPFVLLPMGADQLRNAARCDELGVARVLDPVAVTPEGVAEAVAGVLADGRLRAAAERFRDEISALPDPSAAVPLLEQLATGSGSAT